MPIACLENLKVLTDVNGKIASRSVRKLVGLTKPTNKDNYAIGHALALMGWKRFRARFGNKVQIAYYRGRKPRRPVYVVVDPITKRPFVMYAQPLENFRWVARKNYTYIDEKDEFDGATMTLQPNFPE